MKTLLKLKYKSFVQIYLSFELWEKSVRKMKKRKKNLWSFNAFMQLQYNDTSHFKDIDNPNVLITVTYN